MTLKQRLVATLAAILQAIVTVAMFFRRIAVSTWEWIKKMAIKLWRWLICVPSPAAPIQDTVKKIHPSVKVDDLIDLVDWMLRTHQYEVGDVVLCS
jgi:hypothetical protein